VNKDFEIFKIQFFHFIDYRQASEQNNIGRRF
jgi:hypothetical protein